MTHDTLERRLAAMEFRLNDIDNGYAETLYQTHRELIRTQLTLARLAAKSGVGLATDDEVDQALEARA